LPYSWNGQSLSVAGTYTNTQTGSNGCDSVTTLNLTVNQATASTTNTAICSTALPYSWNGQTLTTAGAYTNTQTGANGCDSVTTLNLTVNQATASTTNTAICAASLPYSWNGQSLTAAGTYTNTQTGSNGCDSVTTLNLTVNQATASTTNTSICSSALPYSWNGQSLTTAGTYTDTQTAANGCDSVTTLNLTVNQSATSTVNQSVCAASLPYSWNGQSLTVAGTYTNTQTAANGCDSVTTLNLTVKQAATSTVNQSVCATSLPYSWNGQSLTAAGTYTNTQTGANGCDSIATLNLTVNQATASTINQSVCPASLPYSWNGQSLTAAGTYTNTQTGSNGCDSVTTLNLTVNQATASTINQSVCPASLPYSWNGQTLTTAGAYTNTQTGANGCDSVTTLNLTVNQATASTINQSVCAASLPYSWNGQTLTTAGAYTNTQTGSNGCDSVTTLNLTVNQATASTTNTSICSSALPYSWNGQSLTTAGAYTNTQTAANGCDSVTTLNLTVNQATASTTNLSAVVPYSWNGQNLTTAGVYTYATINAAGCDSIATLNFTVTSSSTQVTINFVWVPGSQTDTTADFDISLQNTGVPTLRFNGIIIRGIHAQNASILTGGIGTISWASLPGTAPTTVTSGLPWTNYDPITNPTGSWWPNLATNLGYSAPLKQLNYSSNNMFFTNLTAPTIPSAAPITIGRFRLKVSGGTFIPNAQFGFVWASTAAVIAYVGTNTTTTSLATAGTNKIVTTSVDQPLNPVPIGTISGNSTVCAGSSANINVAITGGISPYTLIYGNGTNSFTVNNYISGSPIAVSPSTTSTYTITSVNGFTLNHIGSAAITVNLPSSSTNIATACANALPYIWNGQSLTSSGVYTYTTINAAGCDSVATLNFSTNTNTSSTFNAAVILATTCPTVSGGSVIVSATSLSTFTISPVGPTQPSSGIFTNMLGGTIYTVTLTDGNSCTNTTLISATSTSNGELAFATAANASSLPGNICGNMIQTDGSTMNYYGSTCDDLIATVSDTLGGNILGNVNACVTVLATVPTYNGQPYLPRYYDITPTNQGPADITLYFTQDDFDDYNLAAGAFPQIPAVQATGTATFCISQVPGGFLPGASGATTIVHTVIATWNIALNRWEVTLPVASFSGFYCHACNLFNSALPAAITNFKGTKTETTDLLTWSTTSELNNASFTVLYSNDGKNFSRLTSVNSKATSGNSNVVLNYSAENNMPKLGHNYYKLEQMDIDGRSLISTQVVDLMWGVNGSTISVYPNPTFNELNIDIYTTKAENATVKILDMSGRILKEIQTKLVVGANSIQTNIGELATGIYTVQILENNKITQVSKVEKQ
jgi:uncharacterized protein YegP (UPF0339 family)